VTGRDPDVARSKGQSDYEQGFEHGLKHAAAPSSDALKAVVQQYVESYIDLKTGVCRQCYAVPDAGHSTWCFIGKFIAALAAEEAQS